MTQTHTPTWDGMLGTAGGPAFGKALEKFAAERDVSPEHLAQACGLSAADMGGVFLGTRRVGISALARLS